MFAKINKLYEWTKYLEILFNIKIKAYTSWVLCKPLLKYLN